jgi:hypothetical protein
MSCGCGEPDNDHGNPDHITRAQMQRAASAAGVDIEQAADNIHDSARKLTGKAGKAGSGGQRSQDSAAAPGMTQAGTLGSSGGTMGSSASSDEAGTRQDRGVRS